MNFFLSMNIVNFCFEIHKRIRSIGTFIASFSSLFWLKRYILRQEMAFSRISWTFNRHATTSISLSATQKVFNDDARNQFLHLCIMYIRRFARLASHDTQKNRTDNRQIRTKRKEGKTKREQFYEQNYAVAENQFYWASLATCQSIANRFLCDSKFFLFHWKYPMRRQFVVRKFF